MSKKRPSMIDVAREIGMSKSSVSLAMRNSKLLAESTRTKIQKLAREMGYRPNMLFSVMGSGNRNKRKKSDMIQIAFLRDSDDSDKEAASDFRCIPQAAGEYCFSVDLFNLRDYKSARELETTLFSRGYAGVIIGRITDSHSIAYDLELEDFTVISNTNTLWKNSFHRIASYVFRGVQLTWDKCIESSYRRIGAAVCRHAHPVPDDDLRLGAVLERQAHYSKIAMSIPPFTGLPGDISGFIAWVKKEGPDAVIGFHIGQYYALKEKFGSKCPGFACLILIEPMSDWAKPISGVISDEKDIAEVSVSLLDQEIRKRIHGIPEHIMKISLSPKWHEGKTLKN